eukprot:1507187-Rhodomonas_salina.7
MAEGPSPTRKARGTRGTRVPGPGYGSRYPGTRRGTGMRYVACPSTRYRTRVLPSKFTAKRASRRAEKTRTSKFTALGAQQVHCPPSRRAEKTRYASKRVRWYDGKLARLTDRDQLTRPAEG